MTQTPMYHPTPHPGAPPAAWLRMHVQGSMMISMITPTITVNGYRVPARYGENMIQVHPGHNRVEGTCQWLWTYGRAAQTVDIAPGQVVDLWYAGPLLTFMDGAMGPVKQKHGGRAFLYAVIGLTVAFTVVIMALALVR